VGLRCLLPFFAAVVWYWVPLCPPFLVERGNPPPPGLPSYPPPGTGPLSPPAPFRTCVLPLTCFRPCTHSLLRSDPCPPHWHSFFFLGGFFSAHPSNGRNRPHSSALPILSAMHEGYGGWPLCGWIVPTPPTFPPPPTLRGSWFDFSFFFLCWSICFFF